MNVLSQLMLHSFVVSQPSYLLLTGPKYDTSISDCLIAQAVWPLEKHRCGLTLTYTTQKTPESMHPMDSYRQHRSTTTVPLHS